MRQVMALLGELALCPPDVVHDALKYLVGELVVVPSRNHDDVGDGDEGLHDDELQDSPMTETHQSVKQCTHTGNNCISGTLHVCILT